MSDTPDIQDGTRRAGPRKRRALLQWNLMTLFLLIAAAAAWAGYLRCLQRTSELGRRVEVMLQVAADPSGSGDPQKVLARRVGNYWNDRQAWDLSLPDGKFAVRLATHGIKDRGIAPAAFESPLREGRHRIELETTDRRYTILVDGRQVIDYSQEPIPSPFSPFDFTLFDEAENADRPLILFRCAFLWPDQAETDTNGLLLWIERVEAAGVR